MNGKPVMKGVDLILIAFLIVGISILVFGQDTPSTRNNSEKQLREEILSIYKSKGEEGLRDFVKKQGDKISNKFIVDFAEAGEYEREEKWLNACNIIATEKHDQKSIANVIFHTGEYFRLTSSYDKAFDCYEKAIYIFSEINDLIGQGKGYLGEGKLLSYTGRNAEAIELYNNAFLYFEKAGDLLGKGDVYLNKGIVSFMTGDNTTVLEMYERAKLLYDQIGYDSGQAQIFWRKGDFYSYTGKLPNALDMYKKALPLYEKVGDYLGQGNIYRSISEIYLIYGDYAKTLEMSDKSLSFFKMARSPIGQATVYMNKGDIYFQMGDYSNALEMYGKAMFIFEELKSPLGQGNIYLSNGVVYFHSGDNGKAIEMYEKALSFYKKAGDLRGQGHVYFRKGETYLRIDDIQRASAVFENALNLYKKLDDPLGIGSVYINQGDILLNLGDFSRALEMYGKAQSVFEKVDHLLGQANVLLQKGDIYFKKGEFHNAIKMYERSLLFYKKVNETPGLGNVYKCIGNIYLKTGDNAKALTMYEKALAFYSIIGDIESQANILFKKVIIFEKQGKIKEASDLLVKVINNLETVRKRTFFSEMKKNFMGKVYQQYDESVLFMLENKYYEKGFQYAESIRARCFQDQMAEGMEMLKKGLKVNLKAERNRLVGKLSALSRQMQETGGKDEKKLKELKEEYRQVESEFEDLLIKIRLENPLYSSVNYPQPISVPDLQKDVLKKGETLLSYFVSEGKSYAFIVSKDNFNVEALKVKGNEINGLIGRYLPSIKENNIDEMKRFGHLLYEKLFKPLEHHLDKNNDIIIVPMGELETIPFEALVVDKNKQNRPVFLLEKYRLKYVQGATLLSILRKYYTRDNTSKSFIGFGDPVYDYQNFIQNKSEQGSIATASEEETSIDNEIKEVHRDRYARAGGIMDRLPQSGEEVQTIARLFEKESLKNVVHLREQATEENAKAAAMKDFDYIHFSCHGLLNDDFQSLVLSQLPLDKFGEDGYFTLNEIMNCDYNAKLVVLSACETGIGKMYKGEGVTGLTRAVMYAGTPAVVASLWKVNDTATKELMIRFYQNMLEKNMDKVEALRQAKLELINNQTFSSPYYWSAFVMYGE